MELIRERRVTLQICILYKPENSVILLSANLGLERRLVRRKTKDHLLHRVLRREIFLQKSKVMCMFLDIPVSALILYRLLRAAFPFSFFK